MFDLTAMTIAGDATRDHVLSARPAARTRPERPPRAHGDALRRLADRLEPHAARPAVSS